MQDDFYRSQKPPRSGGRPHIRPQQSQQLQYDSNLDKARLDQIVPHDVIQSSRSSKKVRFDQKTGSSRKHNRERDQQFIDQDDSRPDNRDRRKHKKQQAPPQMTQQQTSEIDSFDQHQPMKRMKAGIPLQQYGQMGATDFRASTGFYPRQQPQAQDLYSQQSSKRSSQSKAFEPQYQSSRQVLSWQAKPTKEGFIFFYIPGTNTFQWQFPTYFDTKTNKKKACFLQNWSQKLDQTGKLYYVNKASGMSQEVKPDSETYILQAAMLGNIAFIELYVSVRGDLSIEDQRGRNALHQTVSNGHHQMTQILCEFGAQENLIERTDKHGCTPLFSAIRYNQTDCLQVLLQYNCNLFHRNKKGDTCLHYAAQHNSEESIVILSSFCGEQMLQQRNKDGLRAIDLAEAVKNYSCVNTLQVCERNIVYQNSLLYRDQHIGGGGKQDRAKGMKDPRSIMMSQRSQQLMEGPMPKKNPAVKTFEDDLDQSQDSQADSEDKPSHLEFNDHYQKAYSQRHQEMRVLDHEREYRQKTERDRKTEKQGELRVPRFVTKRPKQQAPQPITSYRSGNQLKEQSYFDEELNSRVSQAAKQRQRDQRYQIYPSQQDEEAPTVFEKAYDGLSKVGSFFASMTTRVVDYVYNETPRASSKSLKRVQPFTEQTRSRSRSLTEGVTGGQRHPMHEDTYNSEFDYQKGEFARDSEQALSSGSEHYKTTYDRSQSRPATAPRSQSRPGAFQLQQQQTDDSLMPIEQKPMYSQRAQPIEPLHNPSSLKFQNQKQWPSREPTRQRQQSPPQQKSISPPPKAVKLISKQTEVSQDVSIVEMRSICIQAQPPKRVRRSKRQANISKHSVGVGSHRIDETTMPLQNLSESNILDSSSSKLEISRRKKVKQIKLGNASRNLITKRYQSEEDDRKRLEESKNYSPSPQPKYMKPEVVIIRRADLMDNGFKQVEAQEPSEKSLKIAVDVAPAAPGLSHNNSVVSVQSRRSLRQTRIQAPTNLTQKQFDIINLNGDVPLEKNDQYKLEVEILNEEQTNIETKPKLGQVTTLAEPARSVEPPYLPVRADDSPPHQQDNSKIKDFYAKLAEVSSLSEDQQQKTPEPVVPQQTNSAAPEGPTDDKSTCLALLDLEFNPEEQDEENYINHNENLNYFERSLGEETLIADLNEEHLTQVSEPSFVPNQNQFKFGQSAASVDKGHLNYSQNKSQQHSIANINQRSFLKPLKMMQQYPDSDCESKPQRQNRRKIIMPVLPKRAQQPQKEIDLFSQDSEKARLQTPIAVAGKSKPVSPDDSYVFCGIKSPDLSLEDPPSQPQIDAPPLVLQQTAQHQSLHSQDRTSSNKNNSAKGQNRYSDHQAQEKEPEEELVQFDITQEVTLTQNVHIEEAGDTIKDQTMQEDISEISLKPARPLLPAKSFKSQKQMTTDEAHVVGIEDQAQQIQGEIDSISMIYGGLEDATVINPNQEEMKINEAIKMPQGYQSSGDECFQQMGNRSTAIQRRNTFMSSDDEGGRPGSRNKQLTKMHTSSVANQSRYKNRKSVKEVNFRKNKNEKPTEDAKVSQEKTPQSSVADRLKASMASFKQNKLNMGSGAANRSNLTSGSRQRQTTDGGQQQKGGV